MKRYNRRSSRQTGKYRRTEVTSSSSSSSSDSNVGETAITYNEFSFGASRRYTSSPVHFLNEEASIHRESASLSSSADSSVSDPLYPNCSVSASEFTYAILDIQNKHGLSDAALVSTIELINRILPVPNRCPTEHQIRNIASTDKKWREIKCANGSYFLLDIEHQMLQILKSNPGILHINFDDSSDIKNSTHFRSVYVPSDDYIYIILNVDGLASVFQSKNYKTWTVLATIVNLSPELRKNFLNILFCCLYYGSVKPDFSFFMRTLVNHLQNVNFRYDSSWIKFKVVTLCADLPAKASCLNMVQFNGYFACPMCLVEGSYCSDSRKVLHPITSEGCLRTQESHCMHVRNAAINGTPSFGVKGPSPLSEVMSVPNVPFDCMHLLYLGIVRTFLLKIMSNMDETLLSTDLINVRVPACFKRKPRCLDHKVKFKATEWKYFILYFHPLFLDHPDNSVKLLIFLLSTVIHMFMQREISDETRVVAEGFIKDICSIAVNLFGPSVQSFSLHALRHLPLQTLLYGGLYNVSASAFESAFFQLKRAVTGTRNEGQLIVKRFLQKQNVLGHVSSASKEERPSVFVLGGCHTIPVDNDFGSYGFDLHSSDFIAYRFQSNNVIFHSESNPRKRSSASFYACLKNGCFVKVDHVIKRKDSILCLCTELCKCGTVADFIDCAVNPHLIANCKTLRVRLGRKLVCCGEDFTGHLILIHRDDSIFATPVLENFEHD